MLFPSEDMVVGASLSLLSVGAATEQAKLDCFEVDDKEDSFSRVAFTYVACVGGIPRVHSCDAPIYIYRFLFFLHHSFWHVFFYFRCNRLIQLSIASHSNNVILHRVFERLMFALIIWGYKWKGERERERGRDLAIEGKRGQFGKIQFSFQCLSTF